MWHWHKNPLNISADIISCVEFNSTGDLLATGDKGGRVVIFQRDKAVRLNIDMDVYFKLHVCICNWGSSMLSILASYFLKVYLAPWAKGSKELFWLKVQLFFWWKFDRCCCKIFTFWFSSPNPLDQFHQNLAQSILGWMKFKFVQIKGLSPDLFQGELWMK